MSDPPLLQRVFLSGERVEPGIYRDVETGTLVRVLRSDELPGGARIVQFARVYVREGDEEGAPDAVPARERCAS